MGWFWAFLLVGSVAYVESGAPTFSSNAVEHIRADFKTVRRTRKDFTRIEITAQPGRMVEDPNDIDTNRVTVETKAGGGDWTVVEDQPSVRGGRYKWTVTDVAPCVQHAFRLWLHGKDGGQAVFEFPSVLPRASNLELVQAQYSPSKPGQLKVEDMGEDSVEVSWEASPCADMYDVTYEKLSGEAESFSQQVEGSSVRLEGLDSCSEYEVRVTAITGQEYSEEATTIVSTAPGYYAAEKLEPSLSATTNSITATWRAFEKLSCVKKYSVAICKEGSACPEGSEVFRNDAMSKLTFTSEANLDQCSDYTLHITPIFKEKPLDERIVPFRTLSQPVEDVALLLKSVEAEAGEEQMITVKWNAIKCASKYEVFQKINTLDGEWEKIGTSKENVFQSKGAPCMEYKYGVKVTIDDQVSEVVEFNEAIMTKIDTSVPYVAANLAIDPTSDGAHLTWDHGKCIKSYKIRTCDFIGKTEECFEEVVIIEDPSMYKMAHTLKNLNSCSKHHVEIFPLTEEDEELATEPRTFTTASPPASPPQEVSVSLNELTNKVDIRWSKVQCAQGYRIHQTLGNSGTKTAWDSEGLSVNLESPEPCVTYSYGVSAIMDGKESEPTALHEVHVPPRTSEPPVMFIEERNNGSVTFVINNADTNHHCEVLQYEVRQGQGEQMFDATALEEGKITVEVAEEEFKIEARLHYKDFDAWSPWVSSDSPRQEALGSEMDFLLVIIVGAVVACALPIILIVTVVLRQRKTQRKYDTEKAEGNTDESKRLNEQSEEKVIKS